MPHAAAARIPNRMRAAKASNCVQDQPVGADPL
jgi:hypothetical protein